jgi:hypothetical protein
MGQRRLSAVEGVNICATNQIVAIRSRIIAQ